MLRIMPYDQSQYCMNSMLTLKIQLLVEETEDNVMRRVYIYPHLMSFRFHYPTQYSHFKYEARDGSYLIISEFLRNIQI